MVTTRAIIGGVIWIRNTLIPFPVRSVDTQSYIIFTQFRQQNDNFNVGRYLQNCTCIRTIRTYVLT